MQCSTLRPTNLSTRPKRSSFCGINFFVAVTHLPLSVPRVQNADYQLSTFWPSNTKRSSAVVVHMATPHQPTILHSHLLRLKDPFDDTTRISIERRPLPIQKRLLWIAEAIQRAFESLSWKFRRGSWHSIEDRFYYRFLCRKFSPPKDLVAIALSTSAELLWMVVFPAPLLCKTDDANATSTTTIKNRIPLDRPLDWLTSLSILVP